MTTTLSVQTSGAGVTRVNLNRPEVHNAFDHQLIRELTEVLENLGQDQQVRVVVISGNGPSFSAGADLNWMQSMVSATEEENRQDALRLATLMRTLAFLPKPTIARVNGAAFGGGVGLIACCDVAIAVEKARFGLTEVRLGLVPAVISPYVVAAIGERQAKRLFQNGQRIDADQAQRIGLLHEVVTEEQLDPTIDKEIELLGQAGPQAQAAAKALVFAVAGRTAAGQVNLDESTANLIARLRVSAEGQEGVGAFLQKRQPNWMTDDSE